MTRTAWNVRRPVSMIRSLCRAMLLGCGICAAPAAAQWGWCPPIDLSAKWTDGEANGISHDGKIVVGALSSSGTYRAYRWTDVGTGQFLKPAPDLGGSANDVSADGSVVVGYMNMPGSIAHAFRWTQATGMQSIGTEGKESEAQAISDDGMVAVGTDWDPVLNAYTATRWVKGGAKQSLGLLAGGYTFGIATAVNDDGSIVAGYCTKQEPSGLVTDRAFRWTQQTGLEPLMDLSGRASVVTDMSSDGQILVGAALDFEENQHAVRWVDGVLDVMEIGIEANSITPDGQTILGLVKNSNYFVWSEENGVTLIPFKGTYLKAISNTGLRLAGSLYLGQWVWVPARTGSRADCDRSWSLTIDDFICFQTRFAVGDPAADYDSDGMLSIDDFISFQTEYGYGCY